MMGNVYNISVPKPVQNLDSLKKHQQIVNQNDELLTPTEVCELLKITPGSLYNRGYRKELTVIKLGKRLNRYLKSEILQLLKSS